MGLPLSDDQAEYATALRGFLSSRSRPSDVRELVDGEEGVDRAVWRDLAGQLGVQGLQIPETYGGSGFTFPDIAVALEESGRALLCAPLLATVTAINALLLSDDPDAEGRLLPAVASGATVLTLAHLDEDDALGGTSGRVHDGGWSLTGTKTHVLDGCVADVLLVTAATDAGLSLFEVVADAPGVTRGELVTMDQTRRQARIALCDAPARLVGGDGAAGDLLAVALDRAVVALALEQCGGARRALEMAVEYALEREQFGRPIGSFQAIKHKCADVLVALERARTVAYAAADAVDTGDPELPALAAVAGSVCSEAYTLAAAENIQIHGGVGYTWEHDAHLYYKRAVSSEILFGAPTVQRARLATALGI